jgi:triphosphatase
MEVELKLALSARHAARVLAEPVIERAALQKPQSAHLVSVYYDTPHFDLRTAGIGLRLRQSPSGWTQTLKWGGSAVGGLHRRGEVETAVPGQQLDLAAISHPDLVRVLAPARVRKRLKPVFVTEFDRASRLLACGGAEIELSVDCGEIVAGSARERICELEMELRAGDPSALFDLAGSLHGAIPLHPLCTSKAERGYMLAGQPQQPAKAHATALDPQMTVARSAMVLVAAGLGQLQENERGMLAGGDAEYLHQMRVAVRRLRALLSAYKSALPTEPFTRLRTELKWLGAKLGAARDWDVMTLETLPALTRELVEQPALQALERASALLRENANRSARIAVRSRRYADIILGLGRVTVAEDWQKLNSKSLLPLVPFAERLLEQRYAAVTERRLHLARLSSDELHALRIKIKRLRYCAEYFASLYDAERTRPLRARLAALQDSLGRINDAVSMRRLAATAAPRGARQIGPLVAGWSACVVSEERGRLLPLWREFRRTRRFW